MLSYLFGGLAMAWAWVFPQQLFLLSFVGLIPLFRNLHKPLFEELKNYLLFFSIWIGVSGFWLSNYSFDAFIFGFGSHVLWYLAILILSRLVSSKTPKYSPLVLVFVWMVADLLVATIPGFIPWYQLGNGFISTTSFDGLIAEIGVYWLSFLVLIINMYLFLCIKLKSYFSLILGVLLLLLPMFFNPNTQLESSSEIKIGLVQPHIKNPTSNLLEVNHVVDLIVYPEGYLNKELVSESSILSGGYLKNKSDEFNVAMFSESNIKYIKRRLLPYVENVINGSDNGFSKGEENVIFTLKNGLTFQPIICIESVFSDLFDKSEADFFVVITNDSWFQGSSAYFLHANHCKVRALESGKTVVRVGNTGISGAFYPTGMTETISPEYKGIKTMQVKIY